MFVRSWALVAAGIWMALAVASGCGSDGSSGPGSGGAPSSGSVTGATGGSSGAGTGGRLASGGAATGGAGSGGIAATGGAGGATSSGGLTSSGGVTPGTGGAGTGGAGVPDAPDSAFFVRWAEPAPGATVKGTARLRLVGRGFVNVEIKRNGTTIATCAVSGGGTLAEANIDTTTLPNGAVTLTAMAWDVPAGEQATQFDDAGPLTVTVDNPGNPPAGTLEPFGVGSHWNEIPMFADMKEAGVQWLRMDISWDHVQPSNGAFSWGNVDAAMTAAAQHGLKIVAVLGYTNDWATSKTGGAGDAHQYAPREEFDDEFGRYVQETVSRYGSQVAAWEVWNEPDHDNFLRIGEGTWAGNRYAGESAVNKKRLEYKHLLDIAMAQPALANKTVTTSGFAEGGSWDTGMRGWLQNQSGFLNQFDVASFHTYGFPGYDRLVNVPAQYRATQSAIGKSPWPLWITEHGINTIINDGVLVKTYLIRSYAKALAQPGVEKLFWFRAGFDPGHMDLFDASRGRTLAYAAYKTLTTRWAQPKSVAAWASGNAEGAIATLQNGKRVAIVWSDKGAVGLNGIGLTFDAAYNHDGATIATNSSFGREPVFLSLTN